MTIITADKSTDNSNVHRNKYVPYQRQGIAANAVVASGICR